MELQRIKELLNETNWFELLTDWLEINDLSECEDYVMHIGEDYFIILNAYFDLDSRDWIEVISIKIENSDEEQLSEEETKEIQNIIEKWNY